MLHKALAKDTESTEVHAPAWDLALGILAGKFPRGKVLLSLVLWVSRGEVS